VGDRKTLSLDVTTGLLPKDTLDRLLVEKMRKAIDGMNDNFANWGFKDPRAVLTYRYWKELMWKYRYCRL
jgi:hypothetical protein